MTDKHAQARERQAQMLAAYLQADGLPGVLVTTQRPWRDIAEETLQHLAKANTDIYVRHGQLVRIGRSEDGTPVIEAISETALKGMLARCMNFVKITPVSGQVQHIPPPDNVVKDILQRGQWPFPPLEAIVEFPVLRPDGTILDTPGYDAATRLLYLPSPSLTIPPIPIEPQWEEIYAAQALIEEAIGEFPYQDFASRLNTYALLLTPIIRQAIGGHVPLALIDATRPGSGKTLLAETVAMIATGRKASLMAAAYDDNEWRKRISATLANGPTIIVIDNVKAGVKLQSAALDLALTSHFVEERILGQSKMARYAQRATWMATGNNIQLGGDMPRRCYWIRLDAHSPTPWTRGGFKHDLETWVPEHRGELIAALLTLARAWYAAGRPTALVPKVGSFQQWVDTIGGILAHLGCEGFLGNLDALYEQADDDAAQWAAFLHAWYEHYGEREVLAAEVEKDLQAATMLNAIVGVDLYNALPDELTPIDKGNFKRRLGKALSARVESQFDESGLHFVKVRADRRSGAVYWKVAGVQETSTDEFQREESMQSSSHPPSEHLGGGGNGQIPAEIFSEEEENKPAKPANLQPEAGGQVIDWQAVNAEIERAEALIADYRIRHGKGAVPNQSS